jgi:hypothetical protein
LDLCDKKLAWAEFEKFRAEYADARAAAEEAKAEIKVHPLWHEPAVLSSTAE